MATILRKEEREFKANPNKINNYRLFSDVSKMKKGIQAENLVFDMRQLNPGQFSAPYHFHRYAEELFMLVAGSMTLRTPAGFEIVNTGDLIFFEKGETGAHQFFNHTEEPCIYLDVRTFIGYDVCEYPDSDKVLLAPSFEIFGKDTTLNYFEGEENILEKWNLLQNKKE